MAWGNAQAQTAPAQVTATLVGTVTGATGLPLAYAVVTIPALDLQQFTNTQGRFYFPKLVPGKYTVSVRQLGYAPANREIILAAGITENISVSMQRLVTRLAAMTVADVWPCDKPGRPGSTSPEQLVQVFEQLEQNAVRMRLLSVQFPFVTWIERRFVLQRESDPDKIEKIDTTRIDSGVQERYKPGSVVQNRRVPGSGREYFLQVPTLLDFADRVFQQNHCFRLRGIDEQDGTSLIRVDFKAASKLKTPDVEGSVFLDATSYGLRRSEIRLTKVPEQVEGLSGLTATTHFEDIMPGLPIVGGIMAVSDLKPVKGRAQYTKSLEVQATLDVKFLKQRPDSVPPAGASRVP